MWTTRPGRWRGRAAARQALVVQWRVGVLRSGVENVVWTDYGEGLDWQGARDAAVEALYERAVLEGVGEYRIQVGDQEGYAWPGLTEAGELDLSIIRDILPRQHRGT